MPRCDVMPGAKAAFSKQRLLAIVLHALRTLGATTATVTHSSIPAATYTPISPIYGNEDSESLPCTLDPSQRICRRTSQRLLPPSSHPIGSRELAHHPGRQRQRSRLSPPWDGQDSLCDHCRQSMARLPRDLTYGRRHWCPSSGIVDWRRILLRCSPSSRSINCKLRSGFSLAAPYRTELTLLTASHPGENIDLQPNAPPPGPYHYPVVPTFGEWIFPSGKLPGTWNTIAKRRSPGVASTSDTTRSRDQCCRMTEAVEETDICHIVPVAEEPWFTRNDMIRYGNKHASSRPSINDEANTMLLRADLHRSFDKRRFTFLPKKQGVLVTHVLESESLRDIYHNVQLNTTYIAPEYFFARFAWTIFPLLKPFLRRGQRRLLLIQGQLQWASPAECSEFADPPSKSRSASPTKKNRSPSKRTRLEMEGGREYASQDSDSVPVPDAATDGAQYPYTKRARRGRSPTPRQSTAASLPPSHRAPTPPRSGKCVPSPESVSSTFGDAAPDPQVEIHKPGDGESRYCLGVGRSPGAQKSPWTPIARPDKSARMTPRRLRAMISCHLVQERKRSDPEGQWEQHEAWLDNILRNGGALDSSEIDRWRFVNGDESIPKLDE